MPAVLEFEEFEDVEFVQKNVSKQLFFRSVLNIVMKLRHMKEFMIF